MAAQHAQNPDVAIGGVPFNPDLAAALAASPPLYVNAKQYHRILKRREARAKFSEGKKKVSIDFIFIFFTLIIIIVIITGVIISAIYF